MTMKDSVFNKTKVTSDKIMKFSVWTPGGLVIPFEITEELQAKLSILVDEPSLELVARELAYETGLKVTVTSEHSVTAQPTQFDMT